jgi:DNA polymerase-3 subunit epsilon
LRILAIDFETSGLQAGTHQVIQIGCAVMEGAEVVASKEWLVGPKKHYKTGQAERAYDVRALEVSGISWKAIKEAPAPAEIVRDLHCFAKDHECKWLPIVAFNASFDFSFYSDLLYMAGDFDRGQNAFFAAWPPFLGAWKCAMLEAKDAVRGLPNYKLDTVSEHFGLGRTTDLHGALEDAILAGRIYHELTLKQASGVAA